MIYRAIQLIQIFLADGRTGERTNEGNQRGPRGPKKIRMPIDAHRCQYRLSLLTETVNYMLFKVYQIDTF